MNELAPWLGELPAPTCSGRCLVVGNSRNLLEDLEKADWRHFDGDLMAVNHAGIYTPNIKHWFTSHGEFFPAWEASRKTVGQSLPGMHVKYTKHAKQGGTNADVYWPVNGRFGKLSGMAAAMVAVALGYGEVLLAGIPADDTGHFYPDADASGYDCYDYGQDKHEKAWKHLNAVYFHGRVKSVSGNTAKWLN